MLTRWIDVTAERWLARLGVLAFLGAGLTALAAVATGHPLVLGAFLLFAALGGVSIARAGAVASPTPIPEANSPRTFADVAGLDDVRRDLEELVDFIRDRNKYLALDAQLPRGVLLYGPPGTGKTLLAKALASEAGASFHYASGASFVEKYVGVGPQRVRELFTRARRSSPAIIFIDEIDSIGRSRASGENAEWESTLNQLLTEIDGFSSTDNILLICATNRRELLDSALLRPGRLDRQVYIGLPDLEAREAIIRVHIQRKPLAPDVEIAALARQTPGLSGAHLAAMVNEAALTAARSDRSSLTQRDFVEGLERVLAGLAGKDSVLSNQERRIVAFHEAGHAVVGHLLELGTIERISLLSRSRALGYVLQVPEEQTLHTRQWLLDRIATLLAGRAAEQVIFGDVSTGASDDLHKATTIAEQMVVHYGMGKRNALIREQALLLSPDVQAEIESIVEEQWHRALSLVEKHRAKLQRLAEALLDQETLEADEIQTLLKD